MFLNEIINLLGRYQIPYSTEYEMQETIEKVLIDNKVDHIREYIFPAEEGSKSRLRVDFMISGTALECKVKGPAMRVYRQVEMYAKFPEVMSILLVTSFHMGLPDLIDNKPAMVYKPGVTML